MGWLLRIWNPTGYRGENHPTVVKGRQYGEVRAVGDRTRRWTVAPGRRWESVEDAILWIEGRARPISRNGKKKRSSIDPKGVVFNGSMLAFAAWMYTTGLRLRKSQKAVFCKETGSNIA